ncbi:MULTISPECIES: hypothetical protein [Xanthomonas]|uniref:Peptidoglycan-binding protein n=1 Tax=Xanthomonas dyei TaxID=743699 RepID=A0ABZ0D3H4_9XANT|nr:hypothetical protein [Xanthomonas dyei]WOB24743.1 hypothetical protein NYR99_13135 [Xanthomonas dyei]WOB52372.1 hypothetical protein NYR95_13140 [Xanthomonas dyei]
MASNGWGALGQALTGGNNEQAYQRGQLNGAKLTSLLADASIKRDEAMQREQLEARLAAAGNSPEQSSLLATALRGGFDPTKITGYTGDVQEQGFRQSAVDRATAGDWGSANAALLGVANGPVDLAAVQGQNLINNRLLPGGGGITTTEQGRSGIAADAARAAASYAAANSSNASAQSALGRLAIAQGQYGLQRAGMWDPDGRTPGKAAAAGGVGKLSEGQSKDVLYYTRGNEANKLLSGFGNNLTATGGQQGAARGVADALLRSLPGVGDSGAVNNLVSAPRQQAEQAGQEFLASILRKDTGAAITREETDLYGKMYLPQPGDSDQSLLQKSRARDIALQAIRASMGNAAAAIPTIAPPAAAPAAGSVARALGAAVAPAGVQRARNPATGQSLVLINGQWVPE